MYTAYGYVANILSTLVKEPKYKVHYEFLMSVLPASLCEEERGIPLSVVEEEIHSLSSIPYEGMRSVQTDTEDHIIRENRRLEFELKMARENLEEMRRNYRAILGKCEHMQEELELLNNKHSLHLTKEKVARPVVDFYSRKPLTEQDINLLRQIPKEGFPLLFEAVQEKHKQLEAVCMAMTEDEYQAMLKEKAKDLAKEAEEAIAEAEDKSESPIALSDSSSTLGPAITETSTPVLENRPEVIIQARAERPDYNHKNWPSPRTKRFAKQIASTLISSSGSWYDGASPKSIKTHEDALNYLAKHAKISVEDLLKISEDEYKRTYVTWSIVYN